MSWSPVDWVAFVAVWTLMFLGASQVFAWCVDGVERVRRRRRLRQATRVVIRGIRWVGGATWHAILSYNVAPDGRSWTTVCGLTVADTPSVEFHGQFEALGEARCHVCRVTVRQGGNRG